MEMAQEIWGRLARGPYFLEFEKCGHFSDTEIYGAFA